MPRRNRARGAPKRRTDEELRAPDLVAAAPPGYQVRVIQPARALKTYLCPGCNSDVKPATKHVVVWRDREEDMRRHWHTPCWDREAKRFR